MSYPLLASRLLLFVVQPHRQNATTVQPIRTIIHMAERMPSTNPGIVDTRTELSQ